MTAKKKVRARAGGGGVTESRRLSGKFPATRTGKGAGDKKLPRASKRAGAPSVPVIDRDMDGAFTGAEMLLHTRLPHAPKAFEYLKHRDAWLNAEALPVLSTHRTLDQLATLGYLLAQRIPVRQVLHMSGLTRAIWDSVPDEVAHLRESARAALEGSLKTRLWTQGAAGDTKAAQMWLDETRAPAPPAPVPTVPGTTVVVREGRMPVGDMILRLAAIYMESRSATDLSAVPVLAAVEVPNA